MRVGSKLWLGDRSSLAEVFNVGWGAEQRDLYRVACCTENRARRELDLQRDGTTRLQGKREQVVVRTDARFHRAVRDRGGKLNIERLDNRRPQHEAGILDPTLPISMNVRGSEVDDERIIDNRR